MKLIIQSLNVPILQMLDWLQSFAYQYGYIGVFLVSLIGALSIVFPIPYTLIIYLLGAVLDPIMVAIAGGLGSALGEFSGYVLGYYGRAILSEERKRKMDFMLKLFDRHGGLIVFLFALTPLPDDLLFIPLGILHQNIIKVFVPCFIGKVLMCLILSFGGRMSIGLIKEAFEGGGGWLATIVTFILFVVIILLMLKVDWEAVFTKYVEGQEGKNVKR